MKYRFTLLYLIMFFVLSISRAQMNYWGILPNKIDFTTSPATKSVLSNIIIPGGSSLYNSQWDENGSLQFYVSGYTVIANGIIVGSLPFPLSTNSSGTPPVRKQYGPEDHACHIVPIPGSSTKKFYVFYMGRIAPLGQALLYSIVDCSIPGKVVVTTPANPMIYEPTTGNIGSIAITKLRADNSRFLFLVTSGVVRYFQITSNGIIAPANSIVYDSKSPILEHFDAEVYEYQDKYRLAYTGMDKIYSIDILPSGLYGGIINTYTPNADARVNNIEFTNDGDFIYATVMGGIYRIPVGGSPTLLAGTTDFQKSQIELAKDGLMYFINEKTLALTTLNPINDLINLSPLTITTSSKDWFTQNLLLPEQVDNENYNCQFSQPSIPQYAKINSSDLNTSCGTITLQGCNPILFRVGHSLTPAFHKFDIQSTDSNCKVVTGNQKINYSSGWIAGVPKTNIDLRTMVDALGLSLGLRPGNAKITYSVKNSCGEIRKIFALINVVNSQIALDGFSLNGSKIISTCTSPYNLYNCQVSQLIFNPIILNSNLPNVDSYKLEIQAVDISCNPITGPGLINYSTDWISGATPNNMDIRNLTDNEGISLASYSGLTSLKYSTLDHCGNITSVSQILRFNNAPLPNLTINGYSNGGTPAPASTSLPGNSIGVYSGSYNISSDLGVFTNYETIIEEVDCSTGVIIKPICDVNTLIPSGSSNLTALNLNSINVPAMAGWVGGYGYFAQKGYNSCFKLTVNLSNICGSNTAYSYIKNDCICRLSFLGSEDNNDTANMFYPTIFDSFVTVKYKLEESLNLVSIYIYDLTGKLLANPVKDKKQAGGFYKYNLSTDNLKNGTSVFKLVVNGQVKTQLLTKITE